MQLISMQTYPRYKLSPFVLLFCMATPPASGSILTFDVCLQCPVLLFDRQFLIDLVVLPLS